MPVNHCAPTLPAGIQPGGFKTDTPQAGGPSVPWRARTGPAGPRDLPRVDTRVRPPLAFEPGFPFGFLSLARYGRRTDSATAPDNGSQVTPPPTRGIETFPPSDMTTQKSYRFCANTVGFDRSDGAATVYLADEINGPYLIMQRSSSRKTPDPADLYLEFGDQSTGSHGCLQWISITRNHVEALIADGTVIDAELNVSDAAWTHMNAGLDRVFEGLESLIRRG